MADKTIGVAVAAVATLTFAYFSVWVLVTPFLEDSHIAEIRNIFPPREYAIYAGAIGFTVFLAVYFSIAGLLLVRD